jgi:hypothetical protein
VPMVPDCLPESRGSSAASRKDATSHSRAFRSHRGRRRRSGQAATSSLRSSYCSSS